MNELKTCSRCGGTCPEPDAAHCPYCGSPLHSIKVVKRTSEVLIFNSPEQPGLTPTPTPADLPDAARGRFLLDDLLPKTDVVLRQPRHVEEAPDLDTAEYVSGGARLSRGPGQPDLRQAQPGPTARRVHLVVVLGRVLVSEYHFDGGVISVGRDALQDVVLDNPSVSRVHCKIRSGAGEGEFELQDMQTPNGTLVNRREVRYAALQAGDEIGIGKFSVLFQPRPDQLSRLERKGAAGRAAFVEPDAARETRFLSLEDLDHVRRDQVEERGAHLKVLASRGRPGRRLSLRKPTVILGSSAAAEIPLRGWFIHRRHAQIVSAGQRRRIIHLAGFRPVWVNNKAVRERDLRDGDRVRIGANSFIFFDAVD